MPSFVIGARCSSVVRAFAHGAMGCQINPSWWSIELFLSFQPVLHYWCNKSSDMCYLVYGKVHIKEPLLLIRVVHVAAVGLLSHYPSGPVPYVQCHITINKMC